MRDPNRIYKIQAKITTLWSLYPDLRYAQIVAIISTEVKSSSNDGHINDLDIFNVEDDAIEQAVNNLIGEAG